ncbi:hypothetical protein E2C01_060549 [Portunus trituberculatus]|uniref:Uncharacterized protein n=1 Tax=Portunus trituberculatus TaxID=210409 RepID=A0A5B7H5S3_PORTR|nr:hypothetical protein [Portunus trituberculatus]
MDGAAPPWLLEIHPEPRFQRRGSCGVAARWQCGERTSTAETPPSYPDQAPDCPSNTLHHLPLVLKLSSHHRRAVLQQEEEETTNMSIQTQTCLSPAWKQVTLAQRRGNCIFFSQLASNPRLPTQ